MTSYESAHYENAVSLPLPPSQQLEAFLNRIDQMTLPGVTDDEKRRARIDLGTPGEATSAYAAQYLTEVGDPYVAKVEEAVAFLSGEESELSMFRSEQAPSSAIWDRYASPTRFHYAFKVASPHAPETATHVLHGIIGALEGFDAVAFDTRLGSDGAFNWLPDTIASGMSGKIQACSGDSTLARRYLATDFCQKFVGPRTRYALEAFAYVRDRKDGHEASLIERQKMLDTISLLLRHHRDIRHGDPKSGSSADDENLYESIRDVAGVDPEIGAMLAGSFQYHGDLKGIVAESVIMQENPTLGQRRLLEKLESGGTLSGLSRIVYQYRNHKKEPSRTLMNTLLARIKDTDPDLQGEYEFTDAVIKLCKYAPDDLLLEQQEQLMQWTKTLGSRQFIVPRFAAMNQAELAFAFANQPYNPDNDSYMTRSIIENLLIVYGQTGSHAALAEAERRILAEEARSDKSRLSDSDRHKLAVMRYLGAVKQQDDHRAAESFADMTNGHQHSNDAGRNLQQELDLFLDAGKPLAALRCLHMLIEVRQGFSDWLGGASWMLGGLAASGYREAADEFINRYVLQPPIDIKRVSEIIKYVRSRTAAA